MSISENKKETIKVAYLAFIAHAIGKCLSFPVGVIVASILGPSDFGVLAIILLVMQYIRYSKGMFISNIRREVPIAYGRNDIEEVHGIYSTVLTNYAIATIGGLSILWTIYAIGFDIHGGLLRKYITVITFMTLASGAASYLRAYAKGEGKFIIFAQFELVSMIAVPILKLIGVYCLGLTGLLISMAVSSISVATFVYVRLGRPVLRFKMDWQKTVELLGTGIPMYLNRVIDGVFISIGLIMAANCLQQADVGLLSFAMGIAGHKKVPFGTVFMLIVVRQMAVDGGKHGIDDRAYFAKYFDSKLIVYALFMSSLVGVMVLFYGVVIKIFLPKFEPAIPVFVILFFAVNFYNIRPFMYGYIDVTRQMNKRMRILAVGVVVNIALCYLGAKLGYGVIGIATGVAVSLIVVSLNTIYITYKQIFKDPLITYGFVLKLTVISSLLTALIWFYSEFDFFKYGVDYHNIVDMVFAILDCLIKMFTFLVLTFGLYISLFRKNNVYRELKEIADYMYQTVRVRLGY